MCPTEMPPHVGFMALSYTAQITVPGAEGLKPRPLKGQGMNSLLPASRVELQVGHTISTTEISWLGGLPDPS